MLDRKFLLGTSFIVGLATAAAALPTYAMAQPAAPAEEEEDEDDGDVSELVITGSRIKRSEFTSSAPIQVITAEQSTLEGLVDTTEILQQSTVASGSFQVNNQLTGFVTDGGPGANTISLRGLGATRTLVLLNGRRVGPAGTRGTVGPVDLNVIPNSIIERVEILKDGASSIYGSDAVAGVINLITKTNLDGGEIGVFANVPFEGEGEQFRVNASWGKTFDRGYVNASFDYFDSKVLRRRDRDDTSCASDYLFDGVTGDRVDFANTDPSQEASDQFKCYNLFTRVWRTAGTNNFGDVLWTDPGVTYPTNLQGNSGGRRCTPPTYLVCVNVTNGQGNEALPVAGLARQARIGFPGTYPYSHQDAEPYGRASILSPVQRTSLYFTGGYDIFPGVEAYGELLFNKRESTQYGARQFFPVVLNANPGNQFGTTLGTGNPTPIIPLKSDRSQEVDYWRGVIGARGDIGNWSWDIFYQHSDSDATYSTDIIYNDRVIAATQFPVACNQAFIISGGNCASLNGGAGIPWSSARILNGDFNDSEREFLFLVESGNTKYTQDLVEASISGDLFTLPAGPIGAAFGVSWRQDEINDTPGLNERTGNLWGSTSAGITAGSDTVKEVFAEFEVPLLKGLPAVESLDLQVSGRYTDYDSFGSDSTYKIGVNWQITDAWRIRATKGTSFRAPALYELYLANQTSFLGQTAIDPCVQWELDTNPFIQANCAAAGVPMGYTAAGTSSATIITGGGAGILDAETSEAYTVGLIWTPSFIDLSVAVEYFDFLVENQVAQFGAANILNECYTSPTFPADPFCTLFTRNGAAPPPGSAGAFAIQSVNNSYVNVAEQVNRGIDLTLRYEHEFDFGRLTFDSQFTWQLKDTTQLLGGAAVTDDNGETTEPDFTGTASLRFDRGDWTFFWNTDLIGKQSDTEAFGGDVFGSTRYSTTCTGALGTQPCATYIAQGVAWTVVPRQVFFKQYSEFTAYHAFSVRRRMDDWTFQAGIQNIFDERPPSQSTGQFRIGTAAINLYDIRGRRAFFSITKRW